jgi:hypothetical protein
MSNTFCRHLSNGFKIDVTWDNQLLWSPCCYYSKKVPLLDRETFEKELARTSAATDWLPECRLCQQMEASNVGLQVSPRLISFNRITQDLDDGVCANLEMSFDPKCNAACLSCGSYISDTWKKYEYRHDIKDIGIITNHGPEMTDQLIGAVSLDHLEELYILGGEPFYSTSGNQMLRHLHATHPNVSQIRLRYQTNGSIVPDDETKELWKGFKSVEISFSLDGIGRRFEYLRWPLKWHRVERVVDNLLETTTATISVNATISPLNVWYFQELDDWTRDTIPQNRLKWPNFPARPNRCLGTLDLAFTPQALRDDIKDRYGADHRLTKIFSNLEINTDYQQMFDYIKKHDPLRRLNWQKTFPDIVRYFDV